MGCHGGGGCCGEEVPSPHRASCQGGERARGSQRSSPFPPHFECGDPFETFDNCSTTNAPSQVPLVLLEDVSNVYGDVEIDRSKHIHKKRKLAEGREKPTVIL